MLNNFYDKLQKQSPVAVIIIAIAIMLLCGFLMTRITKKLKLPNVTAYIVTSTNDYNRNGISCGYSSCVYCVQYRRIFQIFKTEK